MKCLKLQLCVDHPASGLWLEQGRDNLRWTSAASRLRLEALFQEEILQSKSPGFLELLLSLPGVMDPRG